MTLTIQLPPDLEKALQDCAAGTGLGVEALVLDSLRVTLGRQAHPQQRPGPVGDFPEGFEESSERLEPPGYSSVPLKTVAVVETRFLPGRVLPPLPYDLEPDEATE